MSGLVEAEAAEPYLRLASSNMGEAFAGGQAEWEYRLADASLDVGPLRGCDAFPGE